MRQLIALPCADAELGGSLDIGNGPAALLMVTGGSQTRLGSHRMYERLAKALAENDFSCLRFDRRGVGDSGGEDPGFRGSGPDILAAAAAVREAVPEVRRLYGFGLCDGASALALHGAEAGLDGLILVNPWLVEAEAGEPAVAAVRDHYRKRLTSREGWWKLITGGIDYRKLLRGLLRILRPEPEAPLAIDVAAGLRRLRVPAVAILALGDATAIAAAAELRKGRFADVVAETISLDTDSHTFAGPGDEAMLGDVVLDVLRRFEAQAV